MGDSHLIFDMFNVVCNCFTRPYPSHAACITPPSSRNPDISETVSSIGNVCSLYEFLPELRNVLCIEFFGELVNHLFCMVLYNILKIL